MGEVYVDYQNVWEVIEASTAKLHRSGRPREPIQGEAARDRNVQARTATDHGVSTQASAASTRLSDISSIADQRMTCLRTGRALARSSWRDPM